MHMFSESLFEAEIGSTWWQVLVSNSMSGLLEEVGWVDRMTEGVGERRDSGASRVTVL